MSLKSGWNFTGSPSSRSSPSWYIAGNIALCIRPYFHTIQKGINKVVNSPDMFFSRTFNVLIALYFRQNANGQRNIIIHFHPWSWDALRESNIIMFWLTAKRGALETSKWFAPFHTAYHIFHHFRIFKSYRKVMTCSENATIVSCEDPFNEPPSHYLMFTYIVQLIKIFVQLDQCCLLYAFTINQKRCEENAILLGYEIWGKITNRYSFESRCRYHYPFEKEQFN